MKKRVSSLPSVVAKANQHKNRYKDILTCETQHTWQVTCMASPSVSASTCCAEGEHKYI